MLFRNETGNGMMIRLNGNEWQALHPKDEIELPEDKGLNYGLTPIEYAKDSDETEESQEEQQEQESEETQSQSLEDFKKELESINGIGKKTVDDITEIYSSKEALIKDIENGEQIPIRNDQADKIKRYYGSNQE